MASCHQLATEIKQSRTNPELPPDDFERSVYISMNDLNKQAAESIVQMLEPNPPIIFIGAGLSIPPYKPWDDLLKQLSKNMKVNVTNTKNHILAAQKLYESDPEQYLKELRSIFAEVPKICRDALRDIATINFKAFFTTNFDRTIELAFLLANRDLSRPYVYPNLYSSQCRDQSIHFVHGRISEDSKEANEIVFHEKTYRDAYYSEHKLLARYFFDVFFDNDVLFTGFRLSESEPLTHVLKAVNRIMKIRYGTRMLSRSWKILLPKGHLDSDFKERLKELKIEVILYNKINDDYEGLDEVWRYVLMKDKSKMLLKQTEALDPLLSMKKPDWE